MTQPEILERGFMEFSSTVPDSNLIVPHQALLKAADESQIHTFGWPIGVVMHNDPYRPKPYKEGVKATIHTRHGDEETYDFWNLRTNGDYYLIQSLFEDLRSKEKLFLDTRIIRITETFLFISRLYMRLGVKKNELVKMNLKHGGLRGRQLTAANPFRIFSDVGKSEEDVIETQFSEQLGDIEKKVADLVFKAVTDITTMFEFFMPSKEKVVDPLVNNFMAGKIV